MNRYRQPAICWIFDALGIACWALAIFAYFRLGSLVSLAGDVGIAANPATTGRWLSMLGGYSALMYLSPIVGTLFVGFSAVVRAIHQTRVSSPSS